jgi:hypothetical protein
VVSVQLPEPMAPPLLHQSRCAPSLRHRRTTPFGELPRQVSLFHLLVLRRNPNPSSVCMTQPERSLLPSSAASVASPFHQRLPSPLLVVVPLHGAATFGTLHGRFRPLPLGPCMAGSGIGKPSLTAPHRESLRTLGTSASASVSFASPWAMLGRHHVGRPNAPSRPQGRIAVPACAVMAGPAGRSRLCGMGH